MRDPPLSLNQHTSSALSLSASCAIARSRLLAAPLTPSRCAFFLRCLPGAGLSRPYGAPFSSLLVVRSHHSPPRGRPRGAQARLWHAQTGGVSLLDSLWAAVDEVITVADSDVYSYKGDIEGDPFEVEGSLWSFNYFFYNKKLKRILFFTCAAMSKAAMEREEGGGGDGGEGEDDGDVDFADTMDI